MDEPISALDRLKLLVQAGEVKQKSSKVLTELEAKANAFMYAYNRFETSRQTLDAFDVDGLNAIIAEEKEFRALTSQAAKLMGGMDKEEREEVQRITIIAQDEIRARLNAAQTAYDAANSDRRSTLDKALAAIEEYRRAQVVADKLIPGTSKGNALAQQAEGFIEVLELLTPWGQFCKLRKEVQDTNPNFHQIPQVIQRCTMRIWIATYRKIQEAFALLAESEYTPQQSEEVAGLFKVIAGISKYHQPGYVDAFQQGFKADWDQYIQDAKDEMQKYNARAQ